jgi:hypothetical protein
VCKQLFHAVSALAFEEHASILNSYLLSIHSSMGPVFRESFPLAIIAAARAEQQQIPPSLTTKNTYPTT